jgi:hypothetical protein
MLLINDYFYVANIITRSDGSLLVTDDVGNTICQITYSK